MTGPQSLTPEELGRAVRARRLRAGLSQSSLAQAAGVSRGTVRNAEAGKSLSQRSVDEIDAALDLADRGKFEEPRRALPNHCAGSGPRLIYLASDGAQHAIDAEDWDPGVLSERERALYDALMSYTLTRSVEAT